MARKKAVKVQATVVSDPNAIPPELEEFARKHPILAIVGLVALGWLMQKVTPHGPDVPGLYERRNSAWRGKGSFGSAPFGKQSSHR